MALKYTEGTASEQEIYAHLILCNEDFVPPLAKKVNIREYSARIFENAVTFEAWSSDTLVGLVAVYFNDPDGTEGYVTSVSTIKQYAGRHIASSLIRLCIDYARQHGFKTVALEVAKANDVAVNLYKRFRFQESEDRQTTVLMKLDV